MSVLAGPFRSSGAGPGTRVLRCLVLLQISVKKHQTEPFLIVTRGTDKSKFHAAVPGLIPSSASGSPSPPFPRPRDQGGFRCSALKARPRVLELVFPLVSPVSSLTVGSRHRAARHPGVRLTGALSVTSRGSGGPELEFHQRRSLGLSTWPRCRPAFVQLGLCSGGERRVDTWR